MYSGFYIFSRLCFLQPFTVHRKVKEKYSILIDFSLLGSA